VFVLAPTLNCILIELRLWVRSTASAEMPLISDGSATYEVKLVQLQAICVVTAAESASQSDAEIAA
jgi:hypothetical protein